MTVAVSQAGGTPWAPISDTQDGHVHYWPSVGKLVTASAILKLEEDRRLSLDHPISNYVEHVPKRDVIMLRISMNHTASLFSANEDTQVRANGTQLNVDSAF